MWLSFDRHLPSSHCCVCDFGVPDHCQVLVGVFATLVFLTIVDAILFRRLHEPLLVTMVVGVLH